MAIATRIRKKQRIWLVRATVSQLIGKVAVTTVGEEFGVRAPWDG